MALLCFMTLIPYTKPHETPANRIAHLRSRGLIISRPNVAARKIEEIGYERLRIYFLSRRQTNLPNKPFIPGTTYQDILKIYECDQKLRDICFSSVGQFELLFRNAISEVISNSHGSHPYYNVGVFASPKDNLFALQSFARIYEKSKDGRARHYKNRYGDPVLPPIWTIKEFLTFGAAGKIYSCLNNTLKNEIAKTFDIPNIGVFSNWLDCMVDLRNICAHHDRLFNRSFQKQPRILRSTSIPTAPQNKLKAQLECLEHLLAKRGQSSSIVSDAEKIILKYAQIVPSEAGF